MRQVRSLLEKVKAAAIERFRAEGLDKVPLLKLPVFPKLTNTDPSLHGS